MMICNVSPPCVRSIAIAIRCAGPDPRAHRRAQRRVVVHRADEAVELRVARVVVGHHVRPRVEGGREAFPDGRRPHRLGRGVARRAAEDTATVRRLDDVRAELIELSEGPYPLWSGAGGFLRERAEAQYAAAFRAHGLDVRGGASDVATDDNTFASPQSRTWTSP